MLHIFINCRQIFGSSLVDKSAQRNLIPNSHLLYIWNIAYLIWWPPRIVSDVSFGQEVNISLTVSSESLSHFWMSKDSNDGQLIQT